MQTEIEPKPKLKPVSLNVHSYDGIIGPMMHAYFESMGPMPDFDECMTWAREQVQTSSLKPRRKAQATKALNLIAGNKGNYDDKNKIDAKTVFSYTVAACQTVDVKDALVEQLAEIISGGSCAQGRTTRLWSIFYSITSDSETRAGSGDHPRGSD